MPSPKCPRCGSTDVNRAHRSLLERLLIYWKPYRCGECQSRFLVFRKLGKTASTS